VSVFGGLRRWVLLLTLGLVLTPTGHALAKKRKFNVKRYHLTLRHVNTKDRVDNLWVIRVDPKNKNRQWVGKRARKRLEHFLRDWRTGKETRVPERLLWYLYLVGQRFDKPIHIVSGYRSKERKTSRHRHGKAVDFRVEGVDPKEVWEYCKRFDRVGIGYYPNSNFVHLDVRDKSYYWIDESGPGEEADYREGVAQKKPKRKKQRGKSGKRRGKQAGKDAARKGKGKQSKRGGRKRSGAVAADRR
jgi:uncharacterized protein YcbK (DUF882 family)